MSGRSLTVDLDSAAPLADQLRDQIRRKVQAGFTRPGLRLPTVRELALEFGVNANVVARVCGELLQEGYLMPKPGTGTCGIGLAEQAGRRRNKVFDV